MNAIVSPPPPRSQVYCPPQELGNALVPATSLLRSPSPHSQTYRPPQEFGNALVPAIPLLPFGRRRSLPNVPEGHLKVARHFSAGWGKTIGRVPAGRLNLLFLALLTLACSSCESRPDNSPTPPKPPETTQQPTPPPPSDSPATLAKVTLHIGNASLTTELAATQAQEEYGLMNRTKLGDNDGMIFILPRVQTAEFWMKNTLIPLSIAYIDKDGLILEIHDMQPADPNVPDANLPRTKSDSDQVAYALETNLHWFAINGIKPGDKIQPAPSTLGPYVP